MRLILTRHGETIENLKNICQGQMHGTLSEKGIKQAKKLALRLKDEKIDVVYSSDLTRARNTAREILKYHPKIKLIITKDLREQAKGKFEGTVKEKKYNIFESNALDYCKWKPHGGESLIDVWHRIINFFRLIKNKHKNETVLIVGHGGPLSCLLTFLHNKKIENFGSYMPSNSTISIVEFNQGEKPIFKVLNCAKHLD